MSANEAAEGMNIAAKEMRVGHVWGQLGYITRVEIAPTYVRAHFRTVTPKGNLGVPNGHYEFAPDERVIVTEYHRPPKVPPHP